MQCFVDGGVPEKEAQSRGHLKSTDQNVFVVGIMGVACVWRFFWGPQRCLVVDTEFGNRDRGCEVVVPFARQQAA